MLLLLLFLNNFIFSNLVLTLTFHSTLAMLKTNIQIQACPHFTIICMSIRHIIRRGRFWQEQTHAVNKRNQITIFDAQAQTFKSCHSRDIWIRKKQKTKLSNDGIASSSVFCATKLIIKQFYFIDSPLISHLYFCYF